MIEGLSHITFVVKDLERTAHFLNTVFGAREVYSTDGDTFSISKEKFFLIDGLWFAIMEGDPLAEKTYNHVALKVSDTDFEKYVERVRSLNLENLEGQGLLKRLVKKADFVLESFPPGHMASLGISYQELSKINGRIILTSISPFGQTGPRPAATLPPLDTPTRGIF